MLTAFCSAVSTISKVEDKHMRHCTLSGTKAVLGEAFPMRKVLPFKPGETIVAQGDPCTDVHYIKKGVVKLTVVSPWGRAAVLRLLGVGDFFGEALQRGPKRVFRFGHRLGGLFRWGHPVKNDDAAAGRRPFRFGALHELPVAAQAA